MGDVVFNHYYIPDDGLDRQDPFYALMISDPDLPRARHRSERARCWYKQLQWPHYLTWTTARDLHRMAKPPEQQKPPPAVIFVEDIDDKTVSTLREEFHNLDIEFLHRHAFRTTAPEATLGVTEFFISPSIDSGFNKPRSNSGSHFDGLISPVSPHTVAGTSIGSQGGANVALTFFDERIEDTTWNRQHASYRHEAFVSNGSEWNRASTRISCYLLRPGLYLVLIDSPLNISFADYNRVDSTAHMVDREIPYDRLILPHREVFNAYNALEKAFADFTPLCVLELMAKKFTVTANTRFVFQCLLAVSEWQTIIDELEHKTRDLQFESMESLERSTLKALGTFRRTLAQWRGLFADTEAETLRVSKSSAVIRDDLQAQPQPNPPASSTHQGVAEVPDEQKTTEDAVSERTTEAIDAPMLLDKLAKLEVRLDILAKTLNEGIQLFIASVSLRDSEVMMKDSKIMRRDSRIMRQDSKTMKKQAARTTLLTTLAVIYLPLQLITGIFGMNIKEITGDGVPRWWASLVALGIGGVLTSLVYFGVRRWQWLEDQRKEREEEEDEDEDEKKEEQEA